MAKSKELEFRMPDTMAECDSEVLSYMFRHSKAFVIDYERQKVKVTVSSKGVNNVIGRFSKTNFKLTKE